MSYTFRIWFSGLCHFVQNRDINARCALCVVLPKADEETSFCNHVPAIYTVERKQDNCGNLRVNMGDEILKLNDQGKRYRVSFKMTRADNLPMPQSTEISNYGLLWLGDIAGGYADENTDIVSAIPPPTVAAQILLESPFVNYDYNLSVLREWTLPATLTGIDPRLKIKIADPVFVEFSDIRKVKLIAKLIDDPEADPYEFDLPPVGERIEIFIANRCDEDREDDFGEVELRWEGEHRVSFVQIDTDFLFNFRMLHPSTVAAIERVLPKDDEGYPRYPLPESPLLTIEVAPHLCLEIGEDKDIKKSLALFNFVKRGTGSGSGSDCLGAQGLARFTDLDQFIPAPELPVATTSRQKLSMPQKPASNPLISGTEKQQGQQQEPATAELQVERKAKQNLPRARSRNS
jgi:hypothetical protein